MLSMTQLIQLTVGEKPIVFMMVPCIDHYLWMDLNDEVEGYFSKITLADAIAQRDEVRNIKKR